MGHNRQMRAAHSPVSRTGRGVVYGSQHPAPQPGLSVHAVPVVLHLRHWITLVLPQLTGRWAQSNTE